MAKITFKMPRGSEEWDSLDDGEKMEVTCTILKEGPDMGCLVAVDGQTLEGYKDDEDEEDTEPDDNAEEEGAEDDGSMMSMLDKEMQ